jgi:3-oxoacyl-ACP reductase-like protein
VPVLYISVLMVSIGGGLAHRQAKSNTEYRGLKVGIAKSPNKGVFCIDYGKEGWDYKLANNQIGA